MQDNQEKQQRKSMRLEGYDYSQPGAYFITICTKNRECLFGDIVNGEMRLNDAGEMVERWFDELENHFKDIQCGHFICMPNHIHFIINIVGADRCVRPHFPVHPTQSNNQHPKPGQTHRSAPTDTYNSTNLSTIIQWLKTMSTNEYIRGVKHLDWVPFPGNLWQRNYYDHIIRNETDLQRIHEYIQTNPAQWKLDSLHP